MTPRPRRAVARVLAVLAPAAVGLLSAGAVLATGRSPHVVVSSPLAVVLALVGVLTSAGLLGAAAVRADRRRAVEGATVAARDEERAAHRRFLLRLDHEMKNPVTALRAALPGVAPDRAALDPARSRAYDTLEQQTVRLSSLVAELRKLADLETRPLDREDVDLAQVLQDAVADLTDQAAASGAPREITVTVPQAPWPLPHVPGDADLLYLAVHNLLVNALKFSPVGSPVEVRATDDDGAVEVEVADSGCGIPEDELTSVFDELARGEHARGVPGSGLGLALVRVVVQRHGGTVAVRSKVGRGTSVRLRLPAV